MPRLDLPTVLCALMLTSCAATSPDESDILATCQAFFDVIESRDVERGAEITLPEGVFANTRVVDGAPVVGHFSIAQWLQGLPDDQRHYREYFTGTPKVLVDGVIAVVWAEYVFEIDGERSHTGVDAFNLVRTADGWKITGGIYNMVR